MDSKKKKFLKTLEEHHGVVMRACREGKGFNRSTHYLWLDNDPEYAKAVERLNDVVLDFAEDKLHQLIDNGDTTATIFLLKTKGKKRGYVEKVTDETPPPVIISVEVTKAETISIAKDLRAEFMGKG